MLTSSRDNWERLVAAVVKRQQIWELCHQQSRTPSICSAITSHDDSSTEQFTSFSGSNFQPFSVPPSPLLPPADPSIFQEFHRRSTKMSWIKDNLRWGFIRRKLFRSSPSSHHHNQDSIVLHTNNESFSQELNSSSSNEQTAGSDFLSSEEMAAITIQASFRGHLARRAYRALRSLVKLQALVRGVIVRKQARIAMDRMHALARLQITIRARKLMLDN